ncbi:MAG: FtsZ/tubulin family protein [Planctomycetota bacterium]
MAKRKVTSRKRATRKSPTAKARATRKSTTKKRTTTKKRVTPKAKAGRKSTAKKRTTKRKSVTPKAKRKSTTRKRTTTRKTATPKATRKRTTTRKTATPKATRKRTTTRKTATPRAARKPARKVSRRRKPVRRKGEFDFNAWLLPRLELEKYELHAEAETGVKDKIKGSTRYAWIGAGQCGGRIVQSFYDLGYRKVLAVNTTHHDLDLLDIPKEQKFQMDIGSKGAGKDMGRGKNAVLQYQQEILHLTRQTFGTEVDHIMVCVGAGGGTGGGCAADLIEIAKRYARYIGISEPDKRVGAIMTLPAVGEASSPKVAENAWKLATELSEMAAAQRISPLIFIDNDKINKMYSGMTVKSFWPSINSTVAGLFDIFNRLSALSSRYTSFDPVDYHSIMEAGGCAIMGLTTVPKFRDKFAISDAVKNNLAKTLLAGGFDLATAKIAGCIVVAGRKLVERVKGLQENIDYAFDNLSEITGDATVHRGIYEDGRDCLRVYTIIGGLDTCTSRLQGLRSRVVARTR